MHKKTKIYKIRAKYIIIKQYKIQQKLKKHKKRTTKNIKQIQYTNKIYKRTI